MKAFVLTQADFDRLLAEIDRDPSYGERGGSSQVLSPEERAAHERAHRFFNYTVRRWISKAQE